MTYVEDDGVRNMQKRMVNGTYVKDYGVRNMQNRMVNGTYVKNCGVMNIIEEDGEWSTC